MRSLRPRSLTTRIAFVLVAAAAVIFALVAGVLERVLVNELDERDALELIGKVGQARHIAAEISEDEGRRNHSFADLVLGHERLGLMLRRADGTVLARAGIPLDAIVAANAFATVSPDRVPDVRDIESAVVEGRAWKGLNAGLRGRDGQFVTVTAALDATATADLRSTLRSIMLRGTLLVAFGIALAGSLAVWHGMRPLARMAAAARRVSVQHLGERITVPAASAQEIVHLTDALNAMTDRLEDSFTRLSRFSADLAHDLRTPIATLSMQTQFALSRDRTVEEYQTLLVANMKEFERLQRMVNEMLFLARADNAQISLQLEDFHAERELGELAEFFRIMAEERNVRIEIVGHAQLVADRELVRRAVGNLLSNAIRHAPSKSTVWRKRPVLAVLS